MSKRGINFEAFKQLQRILIQKLKQQTCWTILRRFGYDDQLRIKESTYLDTTYNQEEVENAKNIELSIYAIKYLKRLFDSQCNQTNRLDDVALDRIFATTENGIPWKVKLETVYENGITYDIWIGLWQKFFSQNTLEAFKYLTYIGYCGRFIDTVTIFKNKKRDLLKV